MVTRAVFRGTQVRAVIGAVCVLGNMQRSQHIVTSSYVRPVEGRLQREADAMHGDRTGALCVHAAKIVLHVM